VNLQNWLLEVANLEGSVTAYRYADLLDFARVVKTSTLDCTLGWYTIQEWGGIQLEDLLVRSGFTGRDRTIQIESVSGYSHVFSSAEVGEILLATHVGGEPLDHPHGAPLRVVAPSRRGWYWVKWVKCIREVPYPQTG
jgi:DMSO/TMAO reductase YedYZ molybdopterin-dependent catalytic subunit